MAAGAEAEVTREARADEVRVELGARSYTVVVGSDLLAEVGPRLAGLGYGGRAALITSARVGALYRERVVRSLGGAGFESLVIETPDGEEEKTFARLEALYDRLLAGGIERSTPVLALGGGVIGDLAGFAAATLLRGLPCVQLPTTLLAQVDAAIGGKTGVDHRHGKNLIGAFHQPRLVLADVGVLSTLPSREFRAGLAEVVKYGVIGNAALFATIEQRLAEIQSLDPETLIDVVAACARQKAAVVSQDEREERGARAVLNFGHTVGHALEAATDYRALLHGEAVAIGMVEAARISHALGRCPAATVERLTALLVRVGLPTALPAGTNRDELVRIMQRDKKSVAGRVRFVCIEDIGRTCIVELPAEEIARYL